MNLVTLRKTFALIATYTTLIPIAAGLYNFKFLDKNFRLLLYYMILSFITDQVSLFYFFSQANNMAYINVFVLIEPLVLMYVLYQWELKTPARKNDVYFLMIAIIIFWIYEAFLVKDPNGMTGIFMPMKIFSTVNGALIAVFSSVRLLRVVDSSIDLLKNPRFWAITGIFMYSTCSLIVISTNFLVPKSAWILFNITNIIFYLIITKGFLVCRK
ncbi:MAG: hypothetical protein ABI723_00490 [Bacteroidia bacterium]